MLYSLKDLIGGGDDKQMKKKLVFLLILLSASLNMVACGSSQADMDSQSTLTAVSRAAARTRSFLETETARPTSTATISLTPTITLTPTPEPLEQPLLERIQMANPEIGWAINTEDDAVLRTEDGGETWFVVTYSDDPYGNFYVIDEDTVLYNLGIFDVTAGDRPSRIRKELNQEYGGSLEPIPVSWSILDENNLWVTVMIYARVGGAFAIYRTKDGGSSWEQVLIAGEDFAFWRISMVDEKIGWLDGFNIRHPEESLEKRWVIYRTIDGGYTWSPKQLPSPGDALADQVDYCNSNINQTEVQDTLEIFVTCFDESDKELGTWFYRSRLNGQSWRYWLMEGEVFFLDANIGWRAINQDDGTAVVEQTRNGGATWKEMGSMPSQDEFQFWDEEEGWTLTTDDQHTILWITTDGGSTWEEKEPFPGEASITFLDRNHGWAYEKTDLWRTTDGGENWDEIHPIISEKVLPTPIPTVTPFNTQRIPAAESIASMVSEIDGMEMVYVPAGTFLMGSSNEDLFRICGTDCAMNFGQTGSGQPQHEVYLDAYWIDRTEVTNTMYASFLNAEGNQRVGDASWLDVTSEYVPIELVGSEWRPINGYNDHPVVGVSWHGAQAYCEWAGRRLPTESEWEKAALGDDGRIFPWGDVNDNSLANVYVEGVTCFYRDCLGTAPVGSFPDDLSPYGALDMAGNVSEWAWDWSFSEYYRYSPAVNPAGILSGGYDDRRAQRGGSWSSIMIDLQLRDIVLPYQTRRIVGFRCATSYPLHKMGFHLTEIEMINKTDGWGLQESTLWTTRDGGRTWSEVTPPDQSSESTRIETYSAFIDANHAWILYATKDRQPYHSCLAPNVSVWYTTDGGLTWHSSQTISHNFSDHRCDVNLIMTDNQTGWFRIEGYFAGVKLTGTQFIHTTDGGMTWQEIETAWRDTTGSSSTKLLGLLSGMAFTNNRIGWLVGQSLTGDSNRQYFGHASARVDFQPSYHITDDGGSTWAEHQFPAPVDNLDLFTQYEVCKPYQLNLLSEEVARLKIACSDKKVGVGDIDYIYSTEDGGITWTTHAMPQSAATMSDYYTQMIFFDENHGLLLGRNMWRTDDGGRTWQYINTVSWDGQFSFVDHSHGWAIARNEDEIALVNTSNGGDTWQILHPVIAE